jgi:Ca2+-dependent lipid-binding protein
LIDLNPVWDQIIYTPVHSLKETLLLEVMDYRHLSKDRSLGTVELKVGELADEIPKGAGDSRFFFESTGRKDKSEPILGRGDQYKGQLHYAAEFLPAFTLRDLKFETVPNELQSAVEGIEDGHSDDVDDGSESTSSERRMVTRTITTTEPIGAPERYQTDLQHVDMTETQSADSLKRRNQGIQMSKDGLLAHRRW